MFYCSQCSFTAQFESALSMHHQLHHETAVHSATTNVNVKQKSNTIRGTARLGQSITPTNGSKVTTRTSSATRLLGKLRARICRSKTLFAHPEEGVELTNNFNDTPAQSECTSKAMKDLGSSVSGMIESLQEHKETFACHLCSFDSDRITVLDRHLLNDHKIGLDSLLKLVMAKTKDGLTDNAPAQIYGIRQPYYRPPDEIIENGEFVIETVTPKIKILKHTATNTDVKMSDIPQINNHEKIRKEIEGSMDATVDNDALFEKMQNLNDCMCKFVDSTNAIKKVLSKEYDQKNLESRPNDGHYFQLGLGDQDSPKDWERAHSEKLDRKRCQYGGSRSDKMKYSSDSFYF